MIFIGIEFYKGDTVLCGENLSKEEFEAQTSAVEMMYNREKDNFVELICSMYGWYEVKNKSFAKVKMKYIYDRDAECVLKNTLWLEE